MPCLQCTCRRHASCPYMYWYAFVCSHTVEFTLWKVYNGLHAADMRLVSASADWAQFLLYFHQTFLNQHSDASQDWFIFALSEMGAKNWQNILPNTKPHRFLTSSCNCFPFLWQLPFWQPLVTPNVFNRFVHQSESLLVWESVWGYAVLYSCMRSSADFTG